MYGLIIHYTRYRFEKPDLSPSDRHRIARLSYEDFRREIQAQLNREREDFRGQYPYAHRIAPVCAVLFALGMGLGLVAEHFGWKWQFVTNVFSSMALLGFGGLWFSQLYVLSLLSFSSYLREKRGFYLRVKRRLDRDPIFKETSKASPSP